MNNHKEENKKTKVTRKQFFGIAWIASLFALTGETLAGLFQFINPVFDGGFGGMVRAGLVDEFPPGSMSWITAGRFYLHRLDDGSFLALWQRCTHLGCTVPYEEENEGFHCPCHGSSFSEEGEVLGGPAPRPLDIFPVTIVEGEVFVDTGSPIERTEFNPSQTTQA